eukprot:TRINITY_DN103278_c0_g1_i1.p1 TRINITY_DN103278_c0_g1~~TRINITY_DN103278_c0_g1_i1.p1  ORF type:complete len:472 (-),score=43.87 TRINITY_DN103278_c0_g1_i1:130-1545(-)
MHCLHVLLALSIQCLAIRLDEDDGEGINVFNWGDEVSFAEDNDGEFAGIDSESDVQWGWRRRRLMDAERTRETTASTTPPADTTAVPSPEARGSGAARSRPTRLQMYLKQRNSRRGRRERWAREAEEQGSMPQAADNTRCTRSTHVQCRWWMPCLSNAGARCEGGWCQCPVGQCATGNSCYEPLEKGSVRSARRARGWWARLGSAVSDMIGREYTVDLNDPYLLKMLAACADDVYDFDSMTLGSGHHLELLYHQREQGTLDFLNKQIDWLDKAVAGGHHMARHLTSLIPGFIELNGSQADPVPMLQYGIYRIKDGEHAGKKILSFRGTQTKTSIQQAVSLAVGSPAFWQVKARAVQIAKEHEVDYVTGHSLGGAIAELVTAQTKLPGAAFNAPGICGTARLFGSYCSSGYGGTPFEVYLTDTDPVSHSTSVNTEVAHIARPKWVHTPLDDRGVLWAHSMWALITLHIGRLS